MSGTRVEAFDAPEADCRRNPWGRAHFGRPVRRGAWPMSRIDRHAAPAGSAKIGNVAAVMTV